MPLSWDFIECWLASFGSAYQRQPEQRRNSRGHDAYSLTGGQIFALE